MTLSMNDNHFRCDLHSCNASVVLYIYADISINICISPRCWCKQCVANTCTMRIIDQGNLLHIYLLCQGD